MEQYVVVCTDKRGVFAGVLMEDAAPGSVTLAEARMCVYWDEATRGVSGLAATGPTPGCRITAAVPSQVVYGVTTVMECSVDARRRWESAPWG